MDCRVQREVSSRYRGQVSYSVFYSTYSFIPRRVGAIPLGALWSHGPGWADAEDQELNDDLLVSLLTFKAGGIQS